jgi:hypothetical protein
LNKQFIAKTPETKKFIAGGIVFNFCAAADVSYSEALTSWRERALILLQ